MIRAGIQLLCLARFAFSILGEKGEDCDFGHGLWNVLADDHAASGLGGLVTAQVYPTFREEYRYDPRNQRTQVIRVHPPADGQPERRETTTTAYDGVGNVIAEIDALGRTTQHAYDRLNRRIETTDPLAGKTRQTYDLRDNLLSLTDAAGNTHRFSYDKVNRMRTEARPLGQTIRYAYDANGNLTERIDPLNQRQVHTYDDANRRIRTEAFAAGAGTASRTTTFTFDPRGLLTGYDDGTTSATYVHDANGRKQSEVVDYGRFSLTQGYGYHPNGQKASWTAPDGTLIGFAYTGHGELREVTLPGQGAITMSDFRWTRPETVTYPGGAIRSERYDALQRTRQITLRAGAETQMDWRYTYDSVGNISRIDTEHGRYSFGYDALDRLTEADYPNGPQHDQINASFAPNTFPFADDRYTYDPVGNRLSSQSQPGPWAYNGNHELQQSPFGTTTFNLAGSTTEERTPTDQLIRRFTYDTEERPVEVSNAQGQRIARYYHDPFGRRLWKTLEPGAEGHSGGPAPETIYLAYSDEGYAAEFRIPGTPDAAPTTGPTSYTTIWVHEPDGLWSTGAIAMKTANGWRYPQHDHLATPRIVIDGAGVVTTTIRMNAFGETRHQGEAIANRFPGQLWDSETESSYNLFRSYQPTVGRYTQKDPLGTVAGTNQFLYVHANPLMMFDEFGLMAKCCSGVEYQDPNCPCFLNCSSIAAECNVNMLHGLGCEMTCFLAAGAFAYAGGHVTIAGSVLVCSVICGVEQVVDFIRCNARHVTCVEGCKASGECRVCL